LHVFSIGEYPVNMTRSRSNTKLSPTANVLIRDIVSNGDDTDMFKVEVCSDVCAHTFERVQMCSMTHERDDCTTDGNRNQRDNAALTQLIVGGDERSGGEKVQWMLVCPCARYTPRRCR